MSTGGEPPGAVAVEFVVASSGPEFGLVCGVLGRAEVLLLVKGEAREAGSERDMFPPWTSLLGISVADVLLRSGGMGRWEAVGCTENKKERHEARP